VIKTTNIDRQYGGLCNSNIEEEKIKNCQEYDKRKGCEKSLFRLLRGILALVG
jgi:hypothetical protein